MSIRDQAFQGKPLSPFIIDAHTHIFPQKIAAKATDAIGAFYDLPMAAVGDSEALLKSGRSIGVDRYLVCSSATTPAQAATSKQASLSMKSRNTLSKRTAMEPCTPTFRGFWLAKRHFFTRVSAREPVKCAQ